MIPEPTIPGYSEELRLTYPLTPESLVVDAGGYKGDWASEIYRLYGCEIHIFEPVGKYYRRIVERFARNTQIVVHPAGLSDEDCSVEFGIQNDSTGRFASAPDRERVRLLDVAAVVERMPSIALMKLNIEGSEFPVIERLISSGRIGRIGNLQVQWHHCAPDADKRYEALQAALAKTHELTFDSKWVWQNWRLK